MISREASIHLLFSIIFNQSCKSNSAFKAPKEMLKRLNMKSFNLYELEKIGNEGIYQIIASRPCLHRFPRNMARYIYNSVKKINEEYKSDPRNIWRNKDEIEICKELKELSGIGNHKVSQILIYLYALGEIPEISEYHIKHMSISCSNFLHNMNQDLCFIREI